LQKSQKFGTLLFWIVFSIGAVALMRDTFYQGNDFLVFFRTAQNLLRGELIYSVARDGAMVFKYPPWIAILVSPLGFFPEAAARILWGALEVGSLLYLIRWWTRRGVRLWEQSVVLLFFWGIWAVHALDGQINLMMLAVILKASESQVLRAGLLSTTKIFSSIAFLPWVRRKSYDAKKVALIIGSILMVIGVFQISNYRQNPVAILEGWAEAARSGGSSFDGEKIRGRDNQGMPALALRIEGVPARESAPDVYLGAAFTLIAAGTYFAFSKRRRAHSDTSEDFELMKAIALAMIPVVHPLAWFHLSVFSAPLAGLMLREARGERRRQLIVFLFILCIGAFTQKTLGTFGDTLEWWSVKAWGAVGLIACAFVFTNHTSSQKS
jgi:hypothetical protein